jgi:Protein of unknown function (DUF4242)
MKAYVVEREIPGVGAMNPAQLQKASATSNAALAQLAGRIQWNHSYRTADKTFCLYMAEDEDAIREHARISGFPASRITAVTDMFDPTTAG